MKTTANIIIINSQKVKSEQLSAVIITSVFKEESSVSIWRSSTVSRQHWTDKTATRSPEIPQIPAS